MKRRPSFTGAAIVVFAVLRAVTVIHSPQSYSDTATYHAVDFLGNAPRPWTVPLAWTLFPTDELREGLQLAIGIAAWSTLGVSVSRSVTSQPVNRIVVVAVLLLGVMPQVAAWDAVLLSESLSTSLLVALVAALLGLNRQASLRLIGVTLAITVAWVFARQTNAGMFLALLLPVLVFTLRRLPRRRGLGVAVALIVLSLWSGYAITRPAAAVPERSNAVHILADRVEGNEGMLSFFRAHGYPNVRLQPPLTSTAIASNIDALGRSASAVSWVRSSFTSTYFAYLARHWPAAIWQAVSSAPRYDRVSSSNARARALISVGVEDGLWSLPSGLELLILVVTALLMGFVAIYARSSRRLAVVMVAALGAVAGAVIIWTTTDPSMDLGRQFLPVTLLGRLTVLLAVAFSADALVIAGPARFRSWSNAPDRSQRRGWIVPATRRARLVLASARTGIVTSLDPGALRASTGMLVLGLVAMAGWEDPLLGASSVTRTGRVVLALAALALVFERRRLRPSWRLRPPTGIPLAVLISGVTLVALVLISSETNGCQCSGGAYGLTEVAIWTVLAFAVVSLAPRAALPLLAGAVLGCAVAALVAFVDSRAVVSSSTRWAGGYGNANYFAATQALALPLAVFALIRVRPMAMRMAALVTCLVLGVALLLSYSRSGILAAGAGSFVALIIAVPSKRRVVVACVTAAVVTAAGVVLYPTFSRDRTSADFPYGISVARTTDRSGWQRSATGLIPRGPSRMVNSGSGILRISAAVPNSGVSHPVGVASPFVSYLLRVEARSVGAAVRLWYGLEDNVTSAGPTRAQTRVGRRWRRLRLAWQPSTQAPDARLYLWVPRGTFELRAVLFSRLGAKATPISTELRGVGGNLTSRLNRRESAYVRSRATGARLAIDAFLAHPLFGIGWERFPTYSASRSGVGTLASHNDYLRFAAELGVPGIVALLAVAFSIAWAASRARATLYGSAALGVLVAGAVELAFSNVLSVPAVVLPMATGVAVCIASSTGREPRTTRQTRGGAIA